MRISINGEFMSKPVTVTGHNLVYCYCKANGGKRLVQVENHKGQTIIKGAYFNYMPMLPAHTAVN